jgi:hypothetical protein
MWLDFNHVSHKVTTNLHTYKNWQLLTTSIGGCVLPTKWTITKLDNDYNDNGNSPKSSIACLEVCVKFTMLHLSAC